MLRSRPAWVVLAVLLGLLLLLLLRLLSSPDPQVPGQAQGARAAHEAQPAPGFLPDSVDLQPPSLARSPIEGTQPEELLAAPPLEARIHGALLSPALVPIRGVWYSGVSVTDQAGARTHCGIDRDASYSFTAPAFGTYWLTAAAEGYRGQSVVIELTPEEPVVRADFILQDAVMLRIRLVTPEGGDVFQALRDMKAPSSASHLVPVATAENPGPRFNEVFGSLNNHFGIGHFWDYGPRVAGLPPGTMGLLVLDGDLPAWVSLVHYHTVLESQRVAPGQDEVVFVVSPESLLAGLATVQVQLLDAASGLPVDDAMVSLQGHGGYEREVSTAWGGVAVLKDRMPGLYELSVRADGFERVRLPVDALPGEVTDLGVVELARETTLQGFVFDGDGKPLAAGFTIGLVDAVDGTIRWLRDDTFESEADGSFQVRGLGLHEYVIRSDNQASINPEVSAGIEWVSGLISCDLRSGSLAAFDIHMRPASKIVLQVAGGRGDGMRFRVLEESGRELLASRFYGPSPRSLSLPPGKYRVMLLDASARLLSERSLELGADAVHLEFDPE